MRILLILIEKEIVTESLDLPPFAAMPLLILTVGKYSMNGSKHRSRGEDI